MAADKQPELHVVDNTVNDPEYIDLVVKNAVAKFAQYKKDQELQRRRGASSRQATERSRATDKQRDLQIVANNVDKTQAQDAKATEKQRDLRAVAVAGEATEFYKTCELFGIAGERPSRFQFVHPNFVPLRGTYNTGSAVYKCLAKAIT